MLELTRIEARQLRSIVRYTLLDQSPRGEWPILHFQSGSKGKVIQGQKEDVALCWHQKGNYPKSALAFRSSVLAEFEGSKQDVVTLGQVENGKGNANWTEAGVPREVEFDSVAPDSLPAFPKPPPKLVTMPKGFLSALAEAAKTAAKESSARYGLSRIQLRGEKREMVGTDGRQLLIQHGFSFPWNDDVLIPQLPIFSKKNLLPDTVVEIGLSKTHVIFQVDCWTIAVRVDKENRYPEVQSVLPNFSRVKSKLLIDPDDAAFLVKALPKLPGGKDDYSPITLDFTQPPVLRASGAKTTQVELSRSKSEGQKVCIFLNRNNLLRILQLGFLEVLLEEPGKPLFGKDDHRLYLFVPLNKDGTIQPSSDMVCIRTEEESPSSAKSPHSKRRKFTMTPPSSNGKPHGPGKNAPSPDSVTGVAELIAETEELRRFLQEANNRCNRLLSALKHLRKERRVFRQAVESLRQLNIDG